MPDFTTSVDWARPLVVDVGKLIAPGWRPAAEPATGLTLMMPDRRYCRSEPVVWRACELDIDDVSAECSP